MTARARRLAALAAALLAAGGASSCTDPVPDHAIAALGGEDPAVAPGPTHRPGQPCVLCHSPSGPASDHPFVVGGTIFETQAPDARGAANVEVRFVDAANGGPRATVLTNESGNFFVTPGDWPDITYPFKVAIFRGGQVAQVMTTTVDREGSCNACHHPNLAPPLSPEEADEQRQSYGQIYVTPGGLP